jgi:hypothetical protein
MADNFTELKKTLSSAAGTLSVSGTNMGYSFYAIPTSVNIASEGFITIQDAKSGKAKAELIKQAQDSIRRSERLIENYNEEIAKEQAVINDPNENSIRKDGARRRLAEAQTEKARTEKELAGSQSVLAYANSGFQADLDSLTSKAEAEQKRLDDELKAKQNPAPQPEPSTSGDGQPPTTTDSKKSDNQATDDNPPAANPGQGDASTTVPQPKSATTQQTAGSSSSDTKTPGRTGTTKTQEKPGKRLKNPLGNFASYTYQITLYMITPDAYDLFIQSGRKNINVLGNVANPAGGQGAALGAGAYIIAQSGGINNQTTQRAPGFETDFYIDNLKITTATNGKASLSATNTTAVSFQITEPYGFSFITKLKQASDALQNYSKSTGYKNLSNASKQFFILGIRFQGYDINGNALTGKETLYGDPLDPQGTDNGIFEQFYDIILTKITFKLDGKAVVYNVSAAATAPQEAFGLKRGVVNTPTELSGATVNDYISSLFAKMNKEQEDLVKNKAIKIPNIYKVKYLGDAELRIGNAKIVTESDLRKSTWEGSQAKTTAESNDSAGVKSTPNPTKKIHKVASGTMLLQAITNIIKFSAYVEDALKAVLKANLQPDPKTKTADQVTNTDPAVVSWFNVSVELSKPDWDSQTNDWAYTMTFLISTYETPVIFSAYSNPGMKYYGPHKRYEYWFTGQNSEVLEYSQNFDNTYFNVALNTDPNTDPRATPEENAATQSKQVAVVPGKPQGDTTSRLGPGGQAQNSYVTSLYDPGSYASAKVKILGDPDFLVVESATSINELYSAFYGTNGYTVSANGGQVFIEIDFKEAVDYKNSTGTMSINDSIMFWAYPEEIAKEIKGVSYMVTQVNSNFSNGRFVQDLDLVINTFPGTPFESEAREITYGREEAATANNPGAAPGDSTAGKPSTGLKPAPSTPPAQPTAPGQTPAGSSTSVPQGNSANDDQNPTATPSTTPPVEGREPPTTVPPRG